MKILITKILKIKMMMLNIKENQAKIVKYILYLDSMSNRKRGRKAGQKKSQDLKKLGNGAYNR